jgi:hypothetical protein
MAAGYIIEMRMRPTLPPRPPHLVSILLPVLATGACRAPSDARLYVDASRSEDHAEAASLCARITDGDLRAWCHADLTRLHGRAHPEESRAACASQESGPWRDECHFLLAEGLGSLGRWEEAATACAEARVLAVNCVMHLWAARSRELLGMRDGGPGVVMNAPTDQAPSPDLLAAALPGFEAALSWAERAGVRMDRKLTERAWTQFFQVALSPSSPLDDSICEALEGRARGRCVLGAHLIVGNRLNTALAEMPEARFVATCAQAREAPRAAAIEAGISYVPSSWLDQAAEDAFTRSCNGARREPRTPPSGPPLVAHPGSPR